MAKLFGALEKEKYLAKVPKQQFAEQAANLFASLNAIHPFRDRNGRTQLAFLAILANYAKTPLNLEQLEPQPFLAAVIKSFVGDNKPLAEQIRAML